MTSRLLWRNFDWPLMIAVLALTGIGIAFVYSATISTVDLAGLWVRQVAFAVTGIVALIVVAALDYRHLEMLAPPAYLVLVALLLAVFFIGETQGSGSQRWINVGGTLVQPSEPGKFMLIMFMAWYLSWFHNRLHRLDVLAVAVALLLVPLVLIYTQPNLGMVITYGFLGGTLIMVAGIRYWQLFLMGGSVLAVMPFFLGTLQGYMLQRINVFLNPESDPDAAFNVYQSLIAVGNGGWLGRGFGHGSQNQLHFLRVRHTDFIFSVISEELGWVGAMILLVLLFFVVWRLLRIADMAQDHFGRLLAVGVAAIIFFQTVVNVGMNMSLMPVTGLTLPFVSYGGSSLVSMLMAVGLGQSVVMRHRKIDFQ